MISLDSAGVINRPNLQNENQHRYGLFDQIDGLTLGLSRMICNKVYFMEFQDGRRNSEVSNL